MKRLCVLVAASAVAAGGAFAQTEKMQQQAMKGQKVSEAQCEGLWNQANPEGASSISFDKARNFITDVKAVNPDNDQTIERDEFLKACDRGLIKSGATLGAGSGEGAGGAQQKQEKKY